MTLEIKTEVLFPKLSGAEIDVLYKLYRYGTIDFNDVPSKMGRDGLLKHGYAFWYMNGETDPLLCITLNGVKAYDNGILNEWR